MEWGPDVPSLPSSSCRCLVAETVQLFCNPMDGSPPGSLDLSYLIQGVVC